MEVEEVLEPEAVHLDKDSQVEVGLEGREEDSVETSTSRISSQHSGRAGGEDDQAEMLGVHSNRRR